MVSELSMKMLDIKNPNRIIYELREKNKFLGLKCWKLEQQNKDLRYSFASFRKDDLEQISMLEDMLIELCEDIVEGVSIGKLKVTATEILSNVVDDSELGGANFDMDVDE
jgi:hypothetical protein